MRPFIALTTVAAAVALLAGCSREAAGPVPDEPGPGPTPTQHGPEIRISVTADDAPAGGFAAGDCVGLYVTDYSGDTPGALADKGNRADNVRFSYNGGGWTADTRIFRADDKTRADYYLYYPYTDVRRVGALPAAVSADQSSEAAYRASDMLAGKAAGVAPSDEPTAIKMRHVMSRVEIRLKAGSGYTDESLAAADIAVRINGVRCNATVDLATGTATATGESSTVVPLASGGAYRAIIVPQTVGEGYLITATADGQEHALATGYTFEGGAIHVFTMTVSKTSEGMNVDIDPWENDGSDHGGTAE